MADKRQFKTIEMDPDELDQKIRSHRVRIIKGILFSVGIILLVCAAFFLMLRLRTYSDYTVEESIDREDSASSQFLSYGKGFVKYSNDGAIYTNASNDLYWNQTFEMQDPIVEQCEDYLAFADRGGTNIYILNENGLKGEIETPMNIVKICVANQGTVAVLMESDGTNYIRLYDRNGKNLVKGALHVEKSGYPLDIALCNDANKLAASMLDVSGGKITSSIRFYNFGSVGQNEVDNLVGAYDYEDILIPQIEFMSNDRLVAFGDTKVLIFEGTQKPAPDKEITLDTEVKSVFYSEDYIGLISNTAEDAEESRHMDIYDVKGKHLLGKDFTLDYEGIEFLENGEICIHNADECLIYNTYGVKKFQYTFETPLYKIMSGSTQTSYTFILEGTTEKVRLK